MKKKAEYNNFTQPLILNFKFDVKQSKLTSKKRLAIAYVAGFGSGAIVTTILGIILAIKIN